MMVWFIFGLGIGFVAGTIIGMSFLLLLQGTKGEEDA